MLRQVTLDDIEPLRIGAGILGTGGGGNPYLGSLVLRLAMQRLGPEPIINPMELDDNALVAQVGGIGAPTVSVEKLDEGTEMVRAVQRLESHIGRKIDAIAIAEIGGSNSLRPLLAGLQAGIPTVDSDGMGRAFPEMQMSTFLFESDVNVAPFAMVDAGDNALVVPYTVSDIWAERIARNVAVSMGARAALAGSLMTGAQLKAHGVHYTLTLAHHLGNRVLEAQQEHEDVPEVIAELLSGHVLFRGKIIDVERRTTKGFARGSVTFESYGTERDRLRIEFQNEFLIAFLNGAVVITVPDSICIVTEDTGEPVTTELLRYGTRVAVIAAPAAKAMKTPAALAVIGPRAFGYDVDFRPLPGESIGLPPPNERQP